MPNINQIIVLYVIIVIAWQMFFTLLISTVIEDMCVAIIVSNALMVMCFGFFYWFASGANF